MTEDASNAAVTRFPWHRWFARLGLDFVFAILTFAVPLTIVSPDSPLFSSPWGFALAACLWWIPAETVLVSMTGTTPGKYLVGLRVGKLDGGRLSLSQSFLRSISAWAIGCAAMIPIVAFFTLGYQYQRLKNGKESTWDDEGGFVVLRTSLTFSRQILLAVVVLGLLGFFSLIWLVSATQLWVS